MKTRMSFISSVSSDAVISLLDIQADGCLRWTTKQADFHFQDSLAQLFCKDLTMFTEATKFVRSLRNVEPLKSIVAKEVLPGPECETDEDLRRMCRRLYQPFGVSSLHIFHALRIAYYSLISVDTVGMSELIYDKRDPESVYDDDLQGP